MRKSALVAVVAFVAVACSSSDDDLFGDDGTPPAATADELLAKNEAITNDRISGVYERKGMATGIYESGSSGYTVTNQWVQRTELRAVKLTTVFQCTLTYSEPSRLPKTMTLFTQQEAETTDQTYTLLTAGLQAQTDATSMSECKIDQPAEGWAFCRETIGGSGRFTDLPEGANVCIGRWDQDLYVVRGYYSPDSSLGKKVAN